MKSTLEAKQEEETLITSSMHDDPLLNCLVYLTHHYKSPCSEKTLISGLPLVNNRLTPELFIRAGKRGHIASEINQVSLREINSLVLPVVLLHNDGNASLLVEISTEKAVLLTPETGMGAEELSITQLEQYYSGYSIYAKPIYQFSQRSKETFKRSPKNWFWSVMLKSWPIYSEILVASALINLFALVIPLFIMNVYDRVVPNQAVETMWVLASGVGLVFIFDLLLKTLRAYYIDSAAKKSDVELSALIFQQILGIQMSARPGSVGAFANTIQSFELFRDFITSTTITVLVDLPFVFLYILIIYLLGDNLFLIPLTMVPIIFVIGLLLQLPLTRLTRESYQHAAEKQATLIESLSGIEAIKSSGAESAMQQRWEQIVILSSKIGTKLRFISNSSINFTILAQQISTIILVIAGVYKITEGELTMGALIACTILNGRALAPMSQVAALFTRYCQSVNALKSINKVMQLPTDISKESNFLHRPNLTGNIEFKNVEFCYGEEKIAILNNASFKINSGERVAIIGRIGSGKSTIAKLILGLYQPSKGSILVDGTDYKQINPADLRYQIGYVPQDVVLFYGTVKDNITIGANHIDDAKILRAATIAGVTEFTNKHPAGFDLQVGERGCNLSGGQRQAIAIARALIQSPSIYLLDEPSASMDDSSEVLLRNNFKQHLRCDDTLILITHKASMLNLVDRIIVMDYGKIIADGPKQAVLTALRGGVKTSKGQS